MRTHKHFTLLRLALLAAMVIPGSVRAYTFLEPIGSCTEKIDFSKATVLFDYFNCLYPWVVGVAGGIAVAWGLWAGFGIIIAGGDDSKKDAAKKHFTAAIVGLLIIMLLGTIMNTINPVFFKVG